MKREKRFAKQAHEMRPFATGRGSCIATDEITVKGRVVGYCYRELPSNDTDSGWRFMAGDESREYMDDAANFELYDVNTIANYDPDITPLLDEPAGEAFERDERGRLVRVSEGAPPSVERDQH